MTRMALLAPGTRVIRNAAVNPQLGPTDASVKLEENSRPESSSSVGSLFSSDDEETTLNQEIKEPNCFSEKRSYLLNTMNFSQEEVDLAFHRLGEEATLNQLVDCIINTQGAAFSRVKEKGHATNEVMVQSFYGEEDKCAALLRMGFTETDVSSAIDSFGEEAPVQELADSIFARNIASTIEQEQSYHDDDDDNKRVKRSKHILRDDRGASTSGVVRQPSFSPWSMSFGTLKEKIHADLAKPPYFLYGNIIDITKEAWGDLSRFLFDVQPEFVDSQHFSALARNEGYVHNLPRENRLVLKSSMAIQDVFSSTRQFWPSWDHRKHIYGVTWEVAEADRICGELERMTRSSQAEENRAQIIQQCKKANLIWVGQGRLSALQPQQLERVLGYPADHTNLCGLKPEDRIAAMTYAFQVHNIAHLLSVLKELYPDGLSVLSIYSGVGGAEIALHHLGIRLKSVVSVEESKVNRRILKQWWAKTAQTGKLRQLTTTRELTISSLNELMDEFGGFDLVVGGTYSSWRWEDERGHSSVPRLCSCC